MAVEKRDPQALQALNDQREELLQRVVEWLERPMVILGFVWLALLVIEFVWGQSAALEHTSTAIWVIFVVDFVVEFTIAPKKIAYLRHNWLTAISLAIPALRVFRFIRLLRGFRIARAAREIRLVRVVGSLNRGMRALGATLRRRGFGYVVGLTLIVAFAGAAGMYAFENNNPDGRGLKDYPTALWWTAMILTTMGFEYWPETTEGRVLCVVLALYSFASFGYVTATLATFLIGREAEHPDGEVAGEKSLNALRKEIASLRDEIRMLTEHHKPLGPGT